jgi:type II secretion system protein L
VVAVEDASTTNNQVYIAAIERNLLNDFLHSLQQQKLKPLSVLPDIILLPREGSSWQLSAWPDNQLALRTGLLSGAVLEKNTFNLLLNSALQELKQDESFSIAVSENADIQHQLQSWLDQKNIQTQLVSLPAVNTVLTEKTDWLRHPANMLQGKFSASSSFTVPKIWRIAAAFVAVAFAVQLIAEGVQFGYYRYHARKSQADAVAQYKKLFPDDRRVVNLERQLKSRLEGSNQGGNVLSTLTQVAESLKASGLNAQRIDYTGRTLMLDVQGQAVGELDRLQSQLTTQGFNAEVVSANTQGAVVRGRIKVEG